MTGTTQCNQVLHQYTIDAPMYMIKGYKGSFHPNVESVIKPIIEGKFCVHLFSGSSKLGEVRVDIQHPNASYNGNVYDFIQVYELPPDCGKSILLLDPDYHLKRNDLKLKPHGIKESLAGNVLVHKLLYSFLDRCPFDEILLLDMCSPSFNNYEEVHFWRVKYQGWVHNRTLTWYRRTNQQLPITIGDKGN